jgi:lipopolysaccharide export system protein LptA
MSPHFSPRSVAQPFSLGVLGYAFVFCLGPVAAAQAEEESDPSRASKQTAPPEVLRKTAPPAKRPAATGQPPAPSGNALVTTITAQKRLLLDSQGREATFWGDVKVVDSRFSLACEKLTVFFRDNSAPLKAGEEKEGRGAGVGGLEKAVAEGDVIIFQEKVNERGEVERSVGRSQKAVYDTKTGNIALSGWPQVEQKQNTIVAMEEGTVILLNQKGTLEVLGHSKSVLRSTTGSENGR